MTLFLCIMSVSLLGFGLVAFALFYKESRMSVFDVEGKFKLIWKALSTIHRTQTDMISAEELQSKINKTQIEFNEAILRRLERLENAKFGTALEDPRQTTIEDAILAATTKGPKS